jgi:hypothetical protein
MTISALEQFTAVSLIPAAIVLVECSTFSLNIVGAIINNQQRDLDMRDHLFHRGFAGLDVAVAEKCFGRGDDHFAFPEWQKFNLVALAACDQAAAPAANFSYSSAASKPSNEETSPVLPSHFVTMIIVM